MLSSEQSQEFTKKIFEIAQKLQQTNNNQKDQDDKKTVKDDKKQFKSL